MIKTIKVKKQLRLDELIKYAFDNNITEKHFGSNNGALAVFKKDGSFKLDENFHVRPDSIFTVEVEEEITEDTEFEALVFILVSGRIEVINNYHNIRSARSLIENYETEKQIHAVIDKKLELIWEAENDEL